MRGGQELATEPYFLVRRVASDAANEAEHNFGNLFTFSFVDRLRALYNSLQCVE